MLNNLESQCSPSCSTVVDHRRYSKSLHTFSCWKVLELIHIWAFRSLSLHTCVIHSWHEPRWHMDASKTSKRFLRSEQQSKTTLCWCGNRAVLLLLRCILGCGKNIQMLQNKTPSTTALSHSCCFFNSRPTMWFLPNHDGPSHQGGPNQSTSQNCGTLQRRHAHRAMAAPQAASRVPLRLFATARWSS